MFVADVGQLSARGNAWWLVLVCVSDLLNTKASASPLQSSQSVAQSNQSAAVWVHKMCHDRHVAKSAKPPLETADILTPKSLSTDMLVFDILSPFVPM